jgi:hypothetical protein
LPRNLSCAIEAALSTVEDIFTSGLPSNAQGVHVKNSHPRDAEDDVDADASADASAAAPSLKEVRKIAQSQPSDFYMGSASVRDKLTWFKDGRRQLLVAKSAVAKAALDDEVPCAILSAIVYITKRDCWLMPDAGWTKATSFGKKFADAKLTCTGCAPADSDLKQDFDVVISNLVYFMNRIQTQGAEQVRIFVQHLAGDKIKFRHSPFIVSIYFVIVPLESFELTSSACW